MKVALSVEPIAQASLDACARVVARLAISRALAELGLDSGPTSDHAGGPNNENGPAGACDTDEAKERVR